MAKTARKHHFIPQTYLKGFAAPDSPQLYVTDLERRITFTTAVWNIAAQRDFNKIEVKGLPEDDLEHRLSKVESAVADAIKRIVSAGNLQRTEDLHAVLNLVGLIHTRNPRWRGKMDDFMRTLIKDVARMSVSSREVYEDIFKRRNLEPSDHVSYEEMKEFLEGDGYDVAVRREFHISMELSAASDVIEMLARRNWSFYRAPASSGGFVTSDNPAFLWWNKPGHEHPLYGPGLASPNTTMLFPLTRELCLSGTFEDAAVVAEAPFNAIARINASVVRFADRQVYSADDRFVFLGEQHAVKFGSELLASVPPRKLRKGRP